MAAKNPYFLTLQKYTATNTSSATKKNPHSCCNLLIGIFVKGLNCQRATCLCIMLRQKVVFIEWVPNESIPIALYAVKTFILITLFPTRKLFLSWTLKSWILPSSLSGLFPMVSIIYRVTTTKRKGQGIELIPCPNDLKKY